MTKKEKKVIFKQKVFEVVAINKEINKTAKMKNEENHNSNRFQVNRLNHFFQAYR